MSGLRGIRSYDKSKPSAPWMRPKRAMFLEAVALATLGAIAVALAFRAMASSDFHPPSSLGRACYSNNNKLANAKHGKGIDTSNISRLKEVGMHLDIRL